MDQALRKLAAAPDGGSAAGIMGKTAVHEFILRQV